ncbi:MAG: hypothetical protein P8Z68_12875 [Kineosporiaceae bacterium]
MLGRVSPRARDALRSADDLAGYEGTCVVYWTARARYAPTVWPPHRNRVRRQILERRW